VTGCEHTCFYCYARDIATIRFPGAYRKGFDPDFHPERLDAPRNTRIPERGRIAPTPVERTAWKNCFVCSMADLFGRWVPDDWIEAVFDSCRQSPEWNYLFLTKFPQRYEKLKFPETSWVGTTVDEQKRVANAEKAFRKIDVPVKWLSVEPMLEPIKFTDLSMFDWVVIGGCSQTSGGPEFFPDPRWVHDLTSRAIDAGCKVYWKENVSRKVGMFKEYPDAFTK
jgi:protein gp37